MPITVPLARHGAEPWKQPKVTSVDELVQEACPTEFKLCKDVIQTSFSEDFLKDAHVSASKNGFVWAAFEAYSDHHHLTIRPDDVWLAVLSQINFYINAHAEELRTFFVDHEGQENLFVEVKSVYKGARHLVDWGDVAEQFVDLMQEKVKDPELKEWVIPAFTTTTQSDRVAASILMMGALQSYFTFEGGMTCGLPSVTLLGTRDDWETISNKLDKLPSLGDEPAQFARLLKPVLRHFILSFDNSDDPAIFDFWGRIIKRISMESGPDYLSGWMTAFCFWDKDGKRLGNNEEGCEIDGIKFPEIDFDYVPGGFASVPVTLTDNGVWVADSRMVAGSIGIQARAHNGSSTDTDDVSLDSVQPVTGWWMFEEKTKEELDADKHEEERQKVEEEEEIWEKYYTDEELRESLAGKTRMKGERYLQGIPPRRKAKFLDHFSHEDKGTLFMLYPKMHEPRMSYDGWSESLKDEEDVLDDIPVQTFWALRGEVR